MLVLNQYECADEEIVNLEAAMQLQKEMVSIINVAFASVMGIRDRKSVV